MDRGALPSQNCNIGLLGFPRYLEESAMTHRRIRREGTFLARDFRGRTHEIVRYATSEVSSFEHATPQSAWIVFLRTRQGYHVAQEGRGLYHIIETATDLVSTDPDAP
jgi:hypothetical protein